MCYGDPFYGRDGYYLNWLESQREVEQEPQPEPERNDG
jgi:hypothetical protein